MDTSEDVSRIYVLTQEVKRLKDLTATLEIEKEQLDELYDAQNVKIGELKAQNDSLQSRISRLLPLSERVDLLEDKVMLLESENVQCSKKLIAERNRSAIHEATICEIMFQRNEALQKVDLLTDQLNHLQNEYENALRRGNDELQMHEHSRKKLLASEQKWNNEFIALKSELSQAYATIEQERKNKLGKTELKEYERDEHTFFINQCLEKAEDEKRKLQDDLIEKDEEIFRLNDVCGMREKHIAQLTPYMNECLKLKRELGEYKHAFNNQTRLFRKNSQELVFNSEEPINQVENLDPEPVFLFVKSINNVLPERGIFVDL